MSYTVPTTSATLDVALGPEKAVYERLLFGSDSTLGITPGDFYDMRGYPVPYTPNDVTDITLTLPNGSALVAQNLTVEIIRDEPKTLASHETVMFSPSSEVTNFGARLEQGLNYIKISDPDGNVIGSFALSATRFATIIYAIAVDIYTRIWQPVDATAKEIYDTNTGLFSNIVKFTDLLPQASSKHLLATYLSMRALVSKAGTEDGLNTLAQALLDQTPVSRKIEADNWSALWLRQEPATTVSQVGREMHIWSYDDVATRIVQFGRLCKNIGKSVSQTKFGAQVGDLRYDWRRYLDRTQRSDLKKTAPSYDGHVVALKTTVGLRFSEADGKRSLVQFPGLWDSAIPYFDKGTPLSGTGTFDSADTEGPLGFKGWVGVPVLPAPPFGEAASDGRPSMSVLIAVETVAELQNGMDIKSVTSKSEISWGSSAYQLTAPTPSSSITSATWSNPAHSTVPSDASVDSLPIVEVGLTKSSVAAHTHSVPLFTVGEWKSMLNGGSITKESNLNSDGDHSHTITIKLTNLVLDVTITENHGHFTSMNIPGGLGL